MLFGPRYTASRLWEKLENEDRLEILRKGRAAAETDELTIESTFDLASPLLTPELIVALEYLAVCSPGPVPLDFLQRLAGSEEIEERLEQLFAFSWCERREVEGNRAYELHQLVRELVQRRFGKGFKEEFIQLVHDMFTDEEVHFSIKDRYYLQLEEAFLLAKESKDKRLIRWLYRLFDFCTYRGYGDFYLRLSECVESLFPDDRKTLCTIYNHRAKIFKDWGKLEESMRLLKKGEKIEEELGNWSGLAACFGNQALILRAWCKLDDAMALHKKEEKIKEKLGDRVGLATCFGNQALILQIQGKLEEAMALHKKEETICEELGNRAGLATCFGNQALILQIQGKLEEAMALHKKEETICEELGNRAGLAACFGNQALILSDWSQLEEAMALHKKEETIYEELGDRAGLARSFGNQALILRDWGKLDEAMAFHKKEETICEELGDRAGLAACFGNQALTLSDRGQLDEAMALQKKEETICEELGDRPGLARTWWNQGLIYEEKKDYKKQAQLWQKSIQINKTMGIPTEEDEKALAELEKKMKKK